VFLGHYAAAFAAKRYAPTVSLGLLVICAQFIDLLWPLLLLAGIEHVEITPGITVMTPLDFTDYPISHSLVGVAVWSILLGIIIRMFTRSTRAGVVGALLVFSHWVLDLLVHRPDLPLLSTAGTRVGLGAWNHPWLTVILEGGFFLIGATMYARATTPVSATGRFLWFVLLALLALIYVANVIGPPPPSEAVIAISANALWIVVAISWFLDKHRTPNTENLKP
jgi:membrane-bound metal-dependent hydrolase YbcI (DUF457 family)